MTRIAVVAGEPSGDMHAASLLRELLRLKPDLECFGLGGDQLSHLGMENLYHVRDLAVMGFSELVGKLMFFRRVMRAVRREILARRPAVLLLVDYPGFNLRLASWARSHGLPVFYYIAPQVWAWGRKRLRTMARTIDRLAVILPFEADFFAGAGIDARYVGHPLAEAARATLAAQDFRAKVGLHTGDHALAMLPGSRKHEVERLLPVMARAWEIARASVPSLKPVVALAPSMDSTVAERCWPLAEQPLLAHGLARDALAHARAALVASGTATLEAACMGTPMVVLYKVSPITGALLRRMILIQHVALVNVVAGRQVVPELLQKAAAPSAVADAILPLLLDEHNRQTMIHELSRVKHLLGQPGASARAAGLLAEMLP
jgi:lipid-A-disaccharide synthase